MLRHDGYNNLLTDIDAFWRNPVPYAEAVRRWKAKRYEGVDEEVIKAEMTHAIAMGWIINDAIKAGRLK